MKKYLFGFMALIIAGTLLSFTETKSNPASAKHYWFYFDENGLGQQIGDGMLTKEEAEDLSCIDVPGRDCARAYTSNVNPETPSNQPVDFITTNQP